MITVFTISDLLFLTFFIGSFFKIKSNKIVIALSFFFICFIDSILTCEGMTYLSEIVSPCLELAYICFVFKEKMINNIKIFLLSTSIVSMSEFLSIIILRLFSIDVDPIVIGNINFKEIILLILCVQFFSYSIGYLLVKIHEQKKLNKLMYFTLVPLVALIFVLLNQGDYRMLFDSSHYGLSMYYFFMIIVFVFFVIQGVLLKDLESNREIENQRIEKELTQKKLEMVEQSYRTNFDFFHSLLYETSQLRNRLDSSYSEARLDKIESMVSKQFSKVYTKNPALALVLNEYELKIQKLNIKMSIHVGGDVLCDISYSEQIDIYLQLFDYITKYIVKNGTLLIKSKSNDMQDIIEVIFDIDSKCRKLEMINEVRIYQKIEEDVFKCIILHKKQRLYQ